MIALDAVTKKFGSYVAVSSVSFSLEEGEIGAIVGSSGSGKTTLLRMINRLLEPTTGRISIHGVPNQSIPVHELRRSIGYVIQNYGLFPHYSVAENIAVVPRLLGWDRKKIDLRIDELMHDFDLAPGLRNRRPHELSGGQQQRVGVARALAAKPKLLLMDEPFGALDAVTRTLAQDELLRIHKRYKPTVLFVTHDMDEALKLANKVAVMDKGELLQFAAPQFLVASPANPFIEGLIGRYNQPYRILSLQKVEDFVEPGDAPGEPVASDISLRDAWAECLWSSRDCLPVVKNGNIIGRVTRSTLERQATNPCL